MITAEVINFFATY